MRSAVSEVTVNAALLRQIKQLLAKLDVAPEHASALKLLAECYVKVDEIDAAISVFLRFMRRVAHQLGYLAPFCQLLHQHDSPAKAAALYAIYCERFPDVASLRYNYAYYLRFAGDYELAIKQYQHALKLNISQPEEVLLNIAVIYSDHLRQEQSAERALLQALELNSTYLPAMYNIANLVEERGDKKQAEFLFKRVIEIEPGYYQAYARLADVKTFNNVDDPVITQMLQATNAQTTDLSTKINLHFALGKAFDDCGVYERALSHFQHANQLNSTTMPAYNPDGFALQIRRIISTFDQHWLDTHALASNATPVFICGMFRSGSTLAEQILGQHSHVTAGGEIEFFCRQLKDIYPQQFIQITATELTTLAQNYLRYCQQCFPNATFLTDKRPDNYLYMGLLKTLFPRAKFVYTRRHKLDNCLSVYFLRLGSAMNYANSLAHCLQYYEQHERLMAHWHNMFGEDIYTLDYDKLVAEPEATLQPLLLFLGLEYEPQLLNFYQAKNSVKTASVWQVRQPLYRHASGRRYNYASFLPELQDKLA